MSELKNTDKDKSIEPIVKMRGIFKSFPGTIAVNDVNFDIYKGEVHVLAGENGAGKSTLIKILAGAYSDYSGKIYIDGKLVRPTTPKEANDLGIAVIHQELSLVTSMKVSDNIFLGRSETKFGFIKGKKHIENSKEVLKKLGSDIDVTQNVENYPIATQQLIEIAKVVSIKSKVIIMDEPTSALNIKEVNEIFTLINKLKEQGCGIVYISHRMEEIEKVADRITVLRDGQLIGSDIAKNVPSSLFVKWMVGRKMEQYFPRHITQTGKEVLKVNNLSIFKDRKKEKKPEVDKISFSVKSGEILGIAGLRGSGASELFMGLFGGYKKAISGEVLYESEKLKVESPIKSIKNNIALLTNDRKETGLILSMTLIANSTLANLSRISNWGWRNKKREKGATIDMIKKLNIKTSSLEIKVSSLSGGNQQKVVLSKWLQIAPKLLLLDEPTRGVDVGAKYEIYQLMNEWTSQGIAILLITSEMPELLAMSDRIIVLHRGKITGEFKKENFVAEKIIEAAMGKSR